MNTSLLKLFRVVGLFMPLLLSSLQAYGISQPEQLSLPSLVPVRVDSLAPSHQSAVATTSERRNETMLYDLVQELRTLPVGKRYGDYRQMLEHRGYLVLSNYNDHQHWEFVLEKTKQHLRLIITYNAETRTSTMIAASGARVAAQDLYSRG